MQADAQCHGFWTMVLTGALFNLTSTLESLLSSWLTPEAAAMMAACDMTPGDPELPQVPYAHKAPGPEYWVDLISQTRFKILTKRIFRKSHMSVRAAVPL